MMELENEKSEIEALTKKSARNKKRLDAIENEMAPLKKFLDDARAQRLAIRKEIGMIPCLCR
jgi:hypothetical protein